MPTYPAASNFIEALFSCRGGSTSGTSATGRSIDASAARCGSSRPTSGSEPALDRLDREITDKALWVPLYNSHGADLVSKRVGNYQHSPMRGALLSQLWVH